MESAWEPNSKGKERSIMEGMGHGFSALLGVFQIDGRCWTRSILRSRASLTGTNGAAAINDGWSVGRMMAARRTTDDSQEELLCIILCTFVKARRLVSLLSGSPTTVVAGYALIILYAGQPRFCPTLCSHREGHGRHPTRSHSRE